MRLGLSLRGLLSLAAALALLCAAGCGDDDGGGSVTDAGQDPGGAVTADEGSVSDPGSGKEDLGAEPGDPGTAPKDAADKPEDPGAEPEDAGAGSEDLGTQTEDPGADAVKEDPGPEPGETGGDTVTPTSSWITLGGVMNTRDLGGWPLEGGSRIRWRVLVRSGHLAGIDEAGCTTLEEIGLATVIDLRDGADLENSDAQCVLDQVRYEVASMPKLLPPSAETYTQTLDLSGEPIAKIFSILAEPNALPALYHCVIGRDRVNVVTALIMLALGASRDTVLTEYTLSNEIGMNVDEAWLDPVFDKVEQAGGIDAYLGSLGVTADELAAFRTAALE